MKDEKKTAGVVKYRNMTLSNPTMAPLADEPVKIPRISVSGYILPDPIPSGEIVQGLRRSERGAKKESWKVGKSIGNHCYIINCQTKLFKLS